MKISNSTTLAANTITTVSVRLVGSILAAEALGCGEGSAGGCGAEEG